MGPKMNNKIEESFQTILIKIDNGTVTADDFNNLIKEATPESTRDRLRRRQNHNQNTVRSHQDEDGHAKLELPTMADRVQPKRERADRTQMQHRGKLGHRHSARTQRRTMSKSFKESSMQKSIRFFKENIGKTIDSDLLENIDNKQMIYNMAVKLMSKPGINRDWLSHLLSEIKNV